VILAISKQTRGIILTVLGVLVFIALVLTLFIAGLNKPKILSQADLRNNGAFQFDKPRSFKPFNLIDDNGEPFVPENLQGKWSMVFFGFTYCPDICPTTMALLNRFYDQQLAGRYGDDLQVIMVSVDPARDTPEKLHEYVQYFNPAFIGVTGEFLPLHSFALQLNIPFSKVPGGGDNYTVEHSGNVVLINDRGHYVAFFKAPLDLAKLNLAYQSIRAASE
jgi:protein SCO1/2